MHQKIYWVCYFAHSPKHSGQHFPGAVRSSWPAGHWNVSGWTGQLSKVQWMTAPGRQPQDVHAPSRKEVPSGTLVPFAKVHMAAAWSTINIIDKEENWNQALLVPGNTLHTRMFLWTVLGQRDTQPWHLNWEIIIFKRIRYTELLLVYKYCAQDRRSMRYRQC